MAAVACPEGKENRSGSRTIAVPWQASDGRPRTTVRFMSCTNIWEITKVWSASSDA